LIQTALNRNQDYLALKEHDGGAGTGETSKPAGGEAEYSAGHFQTLETGGKRQKRLAVARGAA
jgi:hypothetical protein